MRLLAVIFLFAAVLLSIVYDVTRAQFFDEPNVNFKKFSFDRQLRGGFNLSVCLLQLLTCLETVRADVICKDKRHYETVCSGMNEFCDEVDGFSKASGNWDNQALFESVCSDFWSQVYT